MRISPYMAIDRSSDNNIQRNKLFCAFQVAQLTRAIAADKFHSSGHSSNRMDKNKQIKPSNTRKSFTLDRSGTFSITDLNEGRPALNINIQLPEIDIGRLTYSSAQSHATNDRNMDRENLHNGNLNEYDDNDDDDDDVDDYDSESGQLNKGRQASKDKSRRVPVHSNTSAKRDAHVSVSPQNKQSHHQHQHHHHHHRRKPSLDGGHVKEFIKPDPTVRRATAARSPNENQRNADEATGGTDQDPVVFKALPLRVVTAVGEEQLHKRLVESGSSGRELIKQVQSEKPERRCRDKYCEVHKKQTNNSNSERSNTSKSNSSSSSSTNEIEQFRSPLPTTILIPPDVAKSLSQKSRDQEKRVVENDNKQRDDNNNASTGNLSSESSNGSNSSSKYHPPNSKITRAQLEYGPFLKQDEVQVLYRNPESADNVLGVFCFQ